MRFPGAQPRAVTPLPETGPAGDAPVAPDPKDFFISYTAVDSIWAEWIAWELEQAGYDVVIQAWDFRPGENFVVEMQNAAAEASRTLLVLSEAYLQSSFARSEWAAAFAQDPTGDQARLVPVRVAPCEPKGLLTSIIFIDLLGLDEATARDKLLAGIEEARAKPPVAPRFPGAAAGAAPAFPGSTTLPTDTSTSLELSVPVIDPVRGLVSALKTVGACAVGFFALALAAGYLTEGSYARLLGLDLESPPYSVLIVSGGQFFISLVTNLLWASLGLVAVALLAVGLHFVLRRLRPGWDPVALRSRLFARSRLLIGLQLLAATVLIVVSLSAFGDLMPLAALPTRAGIFSAPIGLIQDGPRLYRLAVCWAAGVCLVLAGLETWRRRLHRRKAFRKSWEKTLSLLLAIPLYFSAVAEVMLLAVGYGLLYLPNNRQHDVHNVVFKEGPETELSGRSLVLICLKESRGRYTFFCPDPPQLWRDIGKAQLASIGEHRKSTIVELRSRLQSGGCVVKTSSGRTPP